MLDTSHCNGLYFSGLFINDMKRIDHFNDSRCSLLFKMQDEILSALFFFLDIQVSLQNGVTSMEHYIGNSVDSKSYNNKSN